MGIDRYYWKGYEVKGFEYDEGAEVLTLYTLHNIAHLMRVLQVQIRPILMRKSMSIC